MLLSVKVYLFDKKSRDEFYLNLLERAKDLFGDFLVALRKNWVYGYHIEILLNNMGIQECSFVTQELSKMLMCYEQVLEYEKLSYISKQIKVIAQLERYDGEYLPMHKDKSISVEEIDTSKTCFSKIFTNNQYLKLEKLKSSWVLSNANQIKAMIEQEKNNFLAAGLMIIIAKNYSYGPWGGIKYGVLSYYSHYQGFVTQTESLGNTDQLSKLDKDVIPKKNIIQIMTLLDEKGKTDNKIFDSWIEICHKMLYEFDNIVKNEEIDFNKLGSIKNYLKDQEKISEFHNVFTMNERFFEFSSSVEFLCYRLLINELYQLFPLIKISALDKIKLCKKISETAFEYYSMDWKKFYEEIQMTEVS